MLVPVRCGLGKKGRTLMLSAALGASASILFFPWLDAVLAGTAIISATALQTITCSRKKKAKVTREVKVVGNRVYVTLKGPKDATLIDVVTARPVKGALKGVGKLFYQIDLDVYPFVYWNGVIVSVERGACECLGYGSMRELVSSWNVEGLGLGQVVEEEGGFQAVPEIEGTREYRPGDETRLIIWKTLYSPGGLRVKELKKVREVTVLNKGVKTFTADPGPWISNSCFKELFNSVFTYLNKLGLKEVKGRADVMLLGPNAKPEEAETYLLLNPLVCLPPLESEFPAIELVRKKIEKEFKTFERALKKKGDVRVVPWSSPPEFRL